jgi:hypothetical protein
MARAQAVTANEYRNHAGSRPVIFVNRYDGMRKAVRTGKAVSTKVLFYRTYPVLLRRFR